MCLKIVVSLVNRLPDSVEVGLAAIGTGRAIRRGLTSRKHSANKYGAQQLHLALTYRLSDFDPTSAP